ncbi:DUF309 domain-containing protein [Halostella sp. JP-L12]|uniref:DUF309 domain-containing protein n=1 Tax=Halostella TaxID=1843185 RepID=UPI000EF84562|nr:MULTISPECIES: DUF309 domain-containing protein [Halostella]NHN48292.1 DUF309 domain-containing protein [Halostella sp. JP-L12]
MRDHLRAGIAVYNAGEYHAAHDAWEDYWLDLDRGTDDERLLHGLIQFTAAVHHAAERNWAGAAGLVESASGYLAGLPDEYRGVDVAAVRTHLSELGADPERIERGPAPRLTHEGEALSLGDLRFEPAAVAAAVLAEEYERYDADVLRRAAAYGREDLADGQGTSEFVTLVMDFARDAENRAIIYQRLADHVSRRDRRAADVNGLFE